MAEAHHHLPSLQSYTNSSQLSAPIPGWPTFSVSCLEIHTEVFSMQLQRNLSCVRPQGSRKHFTLHETHFIFVKCVLPLSMAAFVEDTVITRVCILQRWTESTQLWWMGIYSLRWSLVPSEVAGWFRAVMLTQTEILRLQQQHHLGAC